MPSGMPATSDCDDRFPDAANDRSLPAGDAEGAQHRDVAPAIGRDRQERVHERGRAEEGEEQGEHDR